MKKHMIRIVSSLIAGTLVGAAVLLYKVYMCGKKDPEVKPQCIVDWENEGGQ